MDFADHLRECLATAGISQAALGRAVGMPGPHINMVCQRKATPPIDKIDKMSAALGLSGEAAKGFRRLALLAHAPGDVRDLVAQLELELSGLRKGAADLLAENLRLREKLAKARRDS